jgi:uncharacterized protein YqeY
LIKDIQLLSRWIIKEKLALNKKGKTMLITDIRSAKFKAMKDKIDVDKDILNVVISQSLLVAKNNNVNNPTDEEVIQVIKKQIKSNEEVIAQIKDKRPDGVEKLEKEIAVMSTFLPKQFTDIELCKIINCFIIGIPEAERSKKSTGRIMKFLKDNYSGLYDGSAASKIISELLK